MNTNNKTYELIKFEDGNFSLDVNVTPNEDTVWLTQEQMAILYRKAKSTINEHINKIFKSSELNINDCLRKFGKTEFSTKPIYYYNLDVILAVGYRVNSDSGILFRRWANSILKQYLMKGHVINENRCIAHSDNLIKMNNDINNINNRLSLVENKLDTITSIDIFKDKIFYNGDMYEGYSFIKDLFNKAIKRIIIIDAYLDYSVLEMLIDINIPITIYIYPSSPITLRELSIFEKNHDLTIIRTNKYHDRFIIIDDELYNIGSSIKDIGRKISHISRLESIDINELLNSYI